jgi:hypothetical protein
MTEYKDLNKIIKFFTFPILIIGGPNVKKMISEYYMLILMFYFVITIGLFILTLILLF